MQPMGKIAAFLLSLLLISSTLHGEIFIEHVYPPALQRGTSTEITLHGSDLEAAIDLWTTLPVGMLAIKPLGDSRPAAARFEITVAEEAPLGLYGLRLATRDGLSNVHLFSIDDLPTVLEQEVLVGGTRNDKYAVSQPVSLPVNIAGICGNQDVDYFSFEVEQGERVAFEVVGNRMGKPFDPVITILDSNQRYVTDRNNDQGLLYDCRFEHTFAAAGRYLVRIHDARYHGASNWSYSLRIGHFPVARVALPSTVAIATETQQRLHFPQLTGSETASVEYVPTGLSPTTELFFFGLRSASHDGSAWLSLLHSPLANCVEVEPNNTDDEATVAVVPCNLHGLIHEDHDTDVFAFDLKQGQQLEFRTDTRNIASAADLELSLHSSDGTLLNRVDDKGFEDAAFSFQVPEDGIYRLKVLDVVRGGGPAYVYRIEVTERQPEIELRAAVGRLAIPQGTWQPVPVSLKRTDFNDTVKLSLVDAPQGFTLRETTLVAGQNALTTGVHVDSSVPTGIYTLQIRATGTLGEETLMSLARIHPLVDRKPAGHGPHGEPFEFREEQRRLPPSLTDRIAVVVLPPAPFDFALRETTVKLPRFAATEFHIETTRADGFAGAIEFVPRGGPLEYNRLQAPGVLAEIPVATVEMPEITAVLTSIVNTNISKDRVTVTATATQGDRKINLTRTFELDTRLAFEPTADPSKLELHAGDSAMFEIVANRLQPFKNAFSIKPEMVEGVSIPGEIVIPAGQDRVVVAIRIDPDVEPGTLSIDLPAETRIGRYAEEAKTAKLEVTVLENVGAE